jgi:glycerol-3-phosphate acyltransferase PlsY
LNVPRIAFHAVAVVQSYLLGAIPFGLLLVRYVKGVDVRTVGSGNIGATNVGRVAGVKLGIIAFILDLGKGLAAATVVPFAICVLANDSYSIDASSSVFREMFVGRDFTDLRIVCGLSAIVGHVWPVFLRFKGGKGIATSLGVMLGLTPWPTLLAFGTWIVVAAVSRYVSVASITAAAAMPVAFLALEWKDLADRWRLLAVIILVTVIVIVRHRGNIRRLIAGTESRIEFKRYGTDA